ncbi:MAG: ABC-F type ribosomal protection protein [Eubacteriales bacterium]|nr:ABC-F type ribosomal protection protein [Eubacteriales bacterium]
MMLISVNDLTFAYEGSFDNIFENASFRFDTDWKLGLIGRNGRGKTTFLKLLQGLYEYGGQISAPVDFSYFPFEPRDPSKKTLDALFEICPGLEQWRIERELTLLEVGLEVLDRPLQTLSPGERTKILLAALFQRENNFLLIDEPTNHLDMCGRAVLSAYLNAKRGFLLVSHDRVFLDGCIDHTLSINRATIEVQKGDFSVWQRNKELRDSFELSQNEILKKDISRLNEAAKRTAQWSDAVERTKTGSGPCDRGAIGHKAARMMQRAKATESRIERAAQEKEKLLKNIEHADSLAIKPAPYFKETLVSAAELSCAYGEKTVFKNIGFTLLRGGRLALCGRNGCGKSSLLKLILGADIPHTGTLRVGSGLILSYVPQDTSNLSGSLKDFAREGGIDESLFKAILRKLDFSREQFEKDMRDFSAGQKKKALIAKSLCERAHLYVWDEPLNYVDVLSRMQIEELLLQYAPTMLFVEHDRAFVNNVATKVLEM